MPWGRRHALLIVLGYSRLLWLHFFSRQTMAVLFRGLEDAFAYFGGVPQELLFDQMRAERGQFAARFEAEGEREASRIRSEAELEAARIRAKGAEEEARIRGESAAEVAKAAAALASVANPIAGAHG